MLSLLMLISCGGGAELEAERDALAAKVEELERDKARLDREAQALNTQVRRMERQLEETQREMVMLRLGMSPGDQLSARLVTSKGDIVCELWPDKSPETVLNFVQLAEGTREWTDPEWNRTTTRPLYNGTIFHRVIPNFMIQGGDPLGTGTGGPGYRFDDETDNGLTFDEPNLLAMANSGPDTNGSQFFITDRATPHNLDGKHTIFGKCDNADVVQSIAEVERDARDKPKQDVVLRRVEILRKGSAG